MSIRPFLGCVVSLLLLASISSPVSAERPPVVDPQAPTRVLPSLTELGPVGPSLSDLRVAMSRNGLWVAIQRPSGLMELWSAASGSITQLNVAGAPADLSDDGRWLVFGAVDEFSRFSTFELDTSVGSVTRLSQPGSFTNGLGSISADGQVRAWWDSVDGWVAARRGAAPRTLETGGRINAAGTHLNGGNERTTIATGAVERFALTPSSMFGAAADDGSTRLVFPNHFGGGFTELQVVDGEEQALWSHVFDLGECCFGQHRNAKIAGDASSVMMSLTEIEGNDRFRLPYRATANGLHEVVIPQADDRAASVMEISGDGRFAVFFFYRDGEPELAHADFTAAPVIPNVTSAEASTPQLSDQIRRLFSAYFDRPADSDGLRFWTLQRAGGLPLAAVSQAFADSPEFIQTYGSLTDPEFVDLVYQNVLNRPPDADGRTFWITQLANGVTRGEMMIGFSESPEYVGLTGTSKPVPTPAGEIVRLFAAVFDRSPDDAGLEYWMGQRSAGQTLESISAFFAVSPEFNETYGSLTDPEFVDLVYQNVLNRPPDADGRTFWITQLANGVTRGEMMIGFSESPENILNTETLPSDSSSG